MRVWAAVGPHESAEEAEDALSITVRDVFGASGVTEHASWIKGHVDNFRMWEQSGTLQLNIESMRRTFAASGAGPDFEAACARFHEESTAEALRLLDELTADPGMEKVKPAMRALLDRSIPPVQIQEQLEANKKQAAERVVISVGENLLRSPSQEAVLLRKFLEELSRGQNSEAITTPEACGLLYLNCFNFACTNPDTEFARVFNALDKQWKVAFANDQVSPS